MNNEMSNIQSYSTPEIAVHYFTVERGFAQSGESGFAYTPDFDSTPENSL